MLILRSGLSRGVLAFFVLAPSLAAQSQPQPGLPPAPAFRIASTTQDITVDGRIVESAWDEAEPIRLAWEVVPGDNVPPPVETVCRMLFDTETLYFACKAQDPSPSEIRAHLAERDNRARTIQDDHIVFLLDPFNDERRGFEFRVNALGVQMDAILARSEGVEDFSWNAVWYSAVQRTAEGYDMEVGIPFSSLRFPRTAGPQTWGLVIDRSYPRNVRHRMRSAPTDRNTDCLLCGANKVTGFQGVEPGNAVEAIPTMTASRTDVRSPFPAGSLEPTTDGAIADIEPDFGIDLRWGVTTSLSLNGTLNPDFSQVEADVAQLAENQRFALFFPETRPFFLEGADFFSTPLQAVFTRSVVDPDAGIKLTGKEGPNAIGVFAARDATTNLLFPANQGSSSGLLDQHARNAVVRYRRDVGASSYVGGLYSGRFGEGYENQVYGVDAFHRLSPSNSLRVQLLGSRTGYPDSTATAFGQPMGTFSGVGFFADYSHFSSRWVASLSYTDLGANLRADGGFVPRVDTRIAAGSLGRIFRGGTDQWFTRLETAATFSRTENHDGTLTDQSIGARLTYDGPLQSQVVVAPSRRTLLFRGVEHDLDRIEGLVRVRPSGSLTLGTEVRTGDFVDFANNRRSFGLSLTPTAELYVGTRLAFTLSQTHQQLRYEGDRVYRADLSQLRALYHFNVRSFVRAIVQYRVVDRVVGQYVSPVDPRDERLFTQLLFSYKVNPQTALFVGYTDGHEGSDVIELTRRTRTLFLKVGYAIQP